MLRRLYDWTCAWPAIPRGAGPGQGDLRQLVLPDSAGRLAGADGPGQPGQVWRYAAICAISSVLGGIAGYFIGLLLFESVAMPILAFYGLLENFEQVAERYNELGWLMVLLGGGFTPLPYKGDHHYQRSDPARPLAVRRPQPCRPQPALRRYLRFAVLGWPTPEDLIERRLGMAFVLMAVMVVGGLMLGKYVL